MPAKVLGSGAVLPQIHGTESIDELARKVATYIVRAVRRPAAFEDFRHSQDKPLKPLCKYLTRSVTHTELVAVLMALKGHFEALELDEADGINAARGLACEYVAVRYTSHLTDRQLIDCLLTDTPETAAASATPRESSPLLGYERQRRPNSALTANHESASESPARATFACSDGSPSDSSDLFAQTRGLNALEIAAVFGAKKFLGDKVIQRIITAIWDGDIIFWSSLSSDATKRAQVYKPPAEDPFCRLRVPKYLKAFEVLFFLFFLAIYYAVLVQRSFDSVTAAEVLLYIWVASFAYQELGEYLDAGTAFYLSDFWTLWDLGIVLTAAAFLLCRIVGLSHHSAQITAVSFDILAMEALFLVPRLFSLLSLHPYFGMLLPCLRDMTKDFLKFLSLVIILYLGFLTTFSLLGRDHFTFRQMSWILIKVFFGSSYLGFDVASEISPVLGPPLMFVFICMTNILLITSLISLLSNTLTKVIEHAADEYKFVYSVYVLEASTSNRLTYFLPPLNLIPLALRPMRLVLSAGKLRDVRIVLLRVCHLPHVVAIQLYEKFRGQIRDPQSDSLPFNAPVGATPERGYHQKRYSRSKNRLSTPQPLAAENLKPDVLLRDEQDMAWSNDETLPDAIEAIRALEATVARLARQVEIMTAANTATKAGQTAAAPAATA
ncbi:hypothetical protein K461DRAFT_232254 [Myriangium duriaei CBS 260.36]|uniref:Calcium channel YVC1-like C-terminal transmembrane domain-containing protein n=1 Tax=Myriangium duriaei CBS 260.36 TaxID=1168546 RepID=A0A9P4IRZ3_9PEZI|nr:hypothetical protein K461DRAFT_232254 [Myriangium duriaei CBS 260.36]